MLEVGKRYSRGLQVPEEGHFLIDELFGFRGQLSLDDQILDGLPVGELSGLAST